MPQWTKFLYLSAYTLHFCIGLLLDNKQSPFLMACLGQVPDTTPIWIMRQAGRILQPYRELRRRHNSISTLFNSPELAADITLMPIDLLGVDAAILFTDLPTPLAALGCEFTYDPGPIFARPVRTAAEVAALRQVDPEADLGFVLETVRLVRKRLPASVPLIGYAGGPFTLAAWLVEGHSSKDFPALRGMLHADPDLAHELFERLTDLVCNYLDAQIRAGAQAVQIFDTSVGLLSSAQYDTFALPYLQRICKHLSPLGVPVIYFPLAAAQSLSRFSKVGATVLSIDWRTDLDVARASFGANLPLQGNLDPCSLYGTEENMIAAVRRILAQSEGQPHIFNLGHGVFPDTPYPMVKLLVETVHEFSRK